MDSPTYGIVHFFPGGTREQYEALIAAVHPAPRTVAGGRDLPCRRVVRRRWTIMAIYESQESWERFRDNILLPKFQEGSPRGFASMPEETLIDVYSFMP